MASLRGDQIRILKILSGDEDSIIHCHLVIASLSEHPAYEALSYVWGDEDDLVDIEVSGQKVGVTRNLYAALSRLRCRQDVRAVWVDQLCINQDDYEEKSTQVKLMREIYSNCISGIIWLGEVQHSIPLKDASAVVDFFNHLDALSSLQPGDLNKPLQPSFTRSALEFRGFLKALRSMGRRECPWWTRIWTVQEAVLPRVATVFWGPFAISWDVFLRLSRHLTLLSFRDLDICSGQSYEDQWAMFEIFRYIKPLASIRTSGFDSLRIMTCWRGRYSTDPRDKVYALSGLQKVGALPSSARCDYTVGVAQVFESVTWDLIQRYGNLKPLSVSPRVGPMYATPGVPGWVLDLGPARGYFNTWSTDGSLYERFSANKGLEPIPIGKQASGTLDLTGMAVDTIIVIEDETYKPKVDMGYQPKDVEEIVKRLRRWYTLMLKHEKKLRQEDQPTCMTREWECRQEFGRLMLNDILRDKDWNVTSDVAEHDVEAVFDYMNTGIPNHTMDSIIAATMWRTFFITEEGMMGLGNLEIQSGDEVWIFNMGRIPFTLRKRPQTQDSVLEYEFFDACYVQGIMQGEFLEKHKPQTHAVRIH